MVGFEVHGEESKENVKDAFGGRKQKDRHEQPTNGGLRCALGTVFGPKKAPRSH